MVTLRSPGLPLVFALLAACAPEEPAAECPAGFTMNADGLCLEDGDDTAPDTDEGEDTDTGGRDSGDTDTDTDTDVPAEYTVCDDGIAPYADIQSAVDAAQDGDTLYVCAGTYNEEVVIDAVAVSLVAPDGPEATEIAAVHNDRVLSVTSGQGPDTVIRGFTLRYGDTADRGGGLHIEDSSPTIEDCVVRDNHAQDGGGVALINSDSVLDGLVIADNSAEEWYSAVYMEGGHPTLVHLWVEGNTSGRTGTIGVRSDSAYDLSNSVLVRNTTPDGASVLSNGDAGLVYNNVVALNVTGDGSNDAAITATAGTWLNNVVWGNSGAGVWCVTGATVSYNVVAGNAGGGLGNLFSCTDETNIEQDPRFVDGEGGDFALDDLSPCIDAGSPASAYNDVDGSRNDVGAYGGPEGAW